MTQERKNQGVERVGNEVKDLYGQFCVGTLYQLFLRVIPGVLAIWILLFFCHRVVGSLFGYTTTELFSFSQHGAVAAILEFASALIVIFLVSLYSTRYISDNKLQYSTLLSAGTIVSLALVLYFAEVSLLIISPLCLLAFLAVFFGYSRSFV